jgi:hypothetical protein
MNIRHATGWSLGVLLALAAAGVSAQTVYKWTDKEGIDHYGHSVPPEYADQVFENRYPTDDPAEVEKKKQSEEDAVLLRTYLSVEEIENLRDERLSLLQAEDRLTGRYLDNLERQLGELEAAAARGAEDAARLDADIAETRRKIAAYEAKLAASEQKQAQTRAEFDADIARFRQLTAANPQPAG